MAEQKLNIRQTRDNTLFYIDGQLQFSSEDEHIYHEMLVHPGAAIVNKRRSSSWRTLILGGGDGLALREILKYRRCAAVDLADHDPDVIEHAKTTFSKLNRNAFDDRRVSVFTEDAESYLRRSDILYDLIISDFTFPNTPETARLFTSDFLMKISERLSENGIFSMNAVSPTQHGKAYQAIFNTLHELKLNPIPLKFSIPSFANHGYGQWGFFFGSRTEIALSELKRWKTKVKTRFIRKERLSESLNNPLTPTGSDIIRTASDMLNLLGVPIPFNVSPTQIDRDWIVRLLNILRSMDIEQLFEEVNRRTERLSASLREQFQHLRRELPLLLKEQVINIERAGQALSVLMLIIIAVNLLCPDNMYAKGYSSSRSSGGSIGFMSQEQPTPFHSKALQMATLAYIVNMQGKTYPKKTVMVDKDKSEESSNNQTEEELFYAVTDDIFLTPSGRVYLAPARFAPYYYRMKPENFTLIREIYAEPILSTMPDNETVYLLLTNLHTQISAVRRTIADYRKWNTWVSPLQMLSDSIRKESVEIGNLEKIKDALNAAYMRFIRYRPVKLPEPNPRKIAPGIYQDNDGNAMLWLADNQWQRTIPDNAKEFVSKAVSVEPKTPQPVQNRLMQMQQMLERQLLDMNP